MNKEQDNRMLPDSSLASENNLVSESSLSKFEIIKNKIGFWILITTAILLIGFFIIGQTIAIFNYEYVVSIGMQEFEEEIGKVGIAFAKGFGFSDIVIYIPLLLFGVVGLLKNKRWGKYTMFGALVISVYWPMVHLYAIFIRKNCN